MPTPPSPSPASERPRHDPYLGLDTPDSQWNRAANRGRHVDPFACRTEWQLSFHETFAPGRRLHLHVDAGNVLAFAEAWHRSLGPILAPVEAHWLFGCPLLGDDAVTLLADVLGTAAARGAPASALVSGVRPRGALARRLAAVFGGRDLVRLPRDQMCSASLRGGFDGYLARRSARLRRSARAAARAAAARGVRFERHAPTDTATADRVYERMLDVESRSWKGIGRCGMTEPPAREFYGVMLRRLAACGSGRVIFARHDEEDVGFIFGGLAGGVYRGQQFSYVEAWRAASIGNLLQMEQVRWLCEEGATRYDMGPMMEYKPHWAERHVRVEAWLIPSR